MVPNEIVEAALAATLAERKRCVTLALRVYATAEIVGEHEIARVLNQVIEAIESGREP